jgi:hypothetical protein
MQQPARKPRLAHRRPARREQLEQARGSEDVEIVDVRMIAITKALAARRVAHPAILDARDAVDVEGDRGLRARQRPDHRFMPDRQRDEDRGRACEDRRRRIRGEDEGRIDHRGDENRDLGVTEMNMRSFARLGGGFTIAFADGVFFERWSHGLQHDVPVPAYMRRRRTNKTESKAAVAGSVPVTKGRRRGPVTAPASGGGLFGADS